MVARWLWVGHVVSRSTEKAEKRGKHGTGGKPRGPVIHFAWDAIMIASELWYCKFRATLSPALPHTMDRAVFIGRIRWSLIGRYKFQCPAYGQQAFSDNQQPGRQTCVPASCSVLSRKLARFGVISLQPPCFVIRLSHICIREGRSQ